MHKQDLIDEITKNLFENNSDTKLTKKDVSAVLDSVMDVIITKVAHDQEVKLVGFGTFKPVHQKERIGRNPKSGDDMLIPAKWVPKFSAGNLFKKRVAAADRPPF